MKPEAHELDPTAAERKKDHIDLAFKSQVEQGLLDERFDYEPMLAAHPKPGSLAPIDFLGKKLRAPIWVSSMTGGTSHANVINHNLARACGEFGMGMGLGSCRQLLYSDEHLADFQVRPDIGPDAPLFANLGIAQLEQLLAEKAGDKIAELLEKLDADGLIIHVNPLQESMQPEGDLFARAPLDTIEESLSIVKKPIIVKEVGQGFGPRSMRALLQLPLAAIEFAAAGGTNFAKLELLRGNPLKQQIFANFTQVGHTAANMLQSVSDILSEPGFQPQTKHLIMSGGVRDFMDGYYLLQKSPLPAVYGQASGFLKHAQADYETLQEYVASQIWGLELAYAYLRLREKK
ncbi:MAG: isopentenyl-diphosphate delta-isomerase [Saprospiraceae bacterium]